jgi:hypothetical protein
MCAAPLPAERGSLAASADVDDGSTRRRDTVRRLSAVAVRRQPTEL